MPLWLLLGTLGNIPKGTAVTLFVLTFLFPGSRSGFPWSFQICSGSRTEMGLCVEGFYFFCPFFALDWIHSSRFSEIFFLGALIRLRLGLGCSELLAFFAVSHSDAIQAELQSLSCWETVFCSLRKVLLCELLPFFVHPALSDVALSAALRLCNMV